MGKNTFLWRRLICYMLKKHVKQNRKVSDLYVVKGIPKTGFFSNYFYAVGHAMLAKKYGYKFVIDWENYVTPYNEGVSVDGTMNCFEYYFDQPCKVDDAIKSAKSIYISEDKYPYNEVPHYGVNNVGREGFPKKKQIKKINEFIKTYCPLKASLKEDFDKLATEMSLQDCLGVHIRGTDMKCTEGHNKPAALVDTIEKIKATLENTGLKRIFLCTDEEGVKAEIISVFGDIVCSLDAYRSEGGNEGIHLETKEGQRENHHYLLGLEVLRDAYMLGCCNSLVCGKSNVAYSAIVFNNNRFNKVVLTN